MTATAPVSILTFDEQTHRYFLDGRPVPNVTSVLEDVGIIDYDYLPLMTRERALERGRNVHLLTQFDDEGDLDENSVPEELDPYLAAWRKFRADSGFAHDLIEHRGYHPMYRYAGTLDRRGRFADGRGAVLLDIKTSAAPWWVRIQLASYAAFFENPMKYRRMSVELHDDATFRIQEFPCREYIRDFGVFTAALTVFNEKRRSA